MVKYGFSRVDSNGDIVSIWNFGDLDRLLRETESDEEVDPVLPSATLHSESEGTASLRTSDVGFEITARYSPCPICALELRVLYSTPWGPLLESVLSAMNIEGCPGCVDDSFFPDFWTHVMCRYNDDVIPDLEDDEGDAKSLVELQSRQTYDPRIRDILCAGCCGTLAAEVTVREFSANSHLLQLTSHFVLHLAITQATCILASVSFEENVDLFGITLEVWFHAITGSLPTYREAE